MMWLPKAIGLEAPERERNTHHWLLESCQRIVKSFEVSSLPGFCNSLLRSSLPHATTETTPVGTRMACIAQAAARRIRFRSASRRCSSRVRCLATSSAMASCVSMFGSNFTRLGTNRTVSVTGTEVPQCLQDKHPATSIPKAIVATDFPCRDLATRARKTQGVWGANAHAATTKHT